MNDYLLDRVEAPDLARVKEFTGEAPVKVGALATALGLEAVKAPLPPKISGLIRPSATAISGFEIRVNKYEIPERQRFTVAHEIAHYLLHRKDIGDGVIDSIMYRSNLTSKKEAEANKLAAAIVMPRPLISRELARLGGLASVDVAEELASLFKVSLPAMKVRLGIA